MNDRQNLKLVLKQNPSADARPLDDKAPDIAIPIQKKPFNPKVYAKNRLARLERAKPKVRNLIRRSQACRNNSLDIFSVIFVLFIIHNVVGAYFSPYNDKLKKVLPEKLGSQTSVFIMSGLALFLSLFLQWFKHLKFSKDRANLNEKEKTELLHIVGNYRLPITWDSRNVVDAFKVETSIAESQKQAIMYGLQLFRKKREPYETVLEYLVGPLTRMRDAATAAMCDLKLFTPQRNPHKAVLEYVEDSLVYMAAPDARVSVVMAPGAAKK